MIRIEDVHSLGERMAAFSAWWVCEPLGEEEIVEKMDGEQAQRLLLSLADEILREEKGVWSTMVYSQRIDDVKIIKVYHPRRAGSSCGGGKSKIAPWWVFVNVEPHAWPEWKPKAEPATPAKAEAMKAAGRTWWKKVFA
ncbi:hypothetical protein MAIT1_02277 [Magnetofaba australis IT-1]|uniref:Uncharacterized protein n=2 Tax=Magnetofaba TaxID=1472292 RepID=A0A1Y2K3H5_9PROT|nr:hypothetical protein MAIT1_02277 [Magnetofaba australis IT-1]